MPSVELSKLQGVGPVRALSDGDRSAIGKSAGNAAAPPSGPQAKGGVAIEVSRALDPSSPPVNTDRINEIRKALRDGSYPLVPAQIADAMIAARIEFGLPK